MSGLYNLEKPAVLIHTKKNIDEKKYIDIFYGIEEEGIPSRKETFELNEGIKLASNASEKSSLGVGIGIDNNWIIVHQEKLDNKEFLFKISLDSSPEAKRELGKNAARLVKKTPFSIKYLRKES
jgi:hypothetical protein